jgi:tetraacyldisaccharide 4'-kinase
MAYRLGWLSTSRLPTLTISVGNLTFGGTGKTPTVVALVRDLVRRGRLPAVLSRGHGRRLHDPVVLVGPDPGYRPEQAGDEPVELASRLPGVPVVVDADRVRGGHEAARLGADVVLLDDGFQHLRVHRDLDLVLVDAGDPWGGGRLPPRGRLREPRTALSRASAVLVTKLPADHGPVMERIISDIRAIAGRLPVLAAHLAATRVWRDGEWCEPDVLAARRVVACAGIGRPEGFLDLLGELRAEVVATRWFPDHHRYSTGDLEAVLAEAERHRAVVVTTAKDAVKLPSDGAVWVIEIDMVPLAGEWDELWRLLPEVAS